MEIGLQRPVEEWKPLVLVSKLRWGVAETAVKACFESCPAGDDRLSPEIDLA